MEPKEITWQAPEFRYRYKDESWYWLTIMAAGILFLISLWQKNLLFAIFIIIAEVMVILWAKELPKNLHFKLDKKGVHLGKIKFYSYEDLSGFHLHEEDGDISELVLKTKEKLHPYVKILLLTNDAPEIKKFLKKHVPEMEYEESLTDSLSKIIGF